MDGSTLLSLRTDLRRLLNEPTASFWSDADLNAYIQKACNKYYAIYQSLVPEFGMIQYDITYPSGAESYAISESDWSFREAIRLEDRTNQTPGVVIPITNSLEALLRAHGVQNENTQTGLPTLAYVGHAQSVSSGTVSNELTIWIAPKPSGTLSLRLHIRALPADISAGDSNTVGLPQVFDAPIILQAAAFARIQEQNSDVGQLNQELARAEEFMYSQIRPYAREAGQVVWESDD